MTDDAHNTPDPKPILTTRIDGHDYTVTEWARYQAAMNMRASADVKERVEKMLKDHYGEEEGMKEARRRYKEAYDE